MFPDSQRPLEKRLSLGVVAYIFIEQCPIVQAGGHIGMLPPYILYGYVNRFLGNYNSTSAFPLSR